MHRASLLPDGRVLIAGGITNVVTYTAEIYDPATKSFAPTGRMANARFGHTATTFPNGNVLLFGGSSSVGDEGVNLVEIYK
jgi:hypothetical protein